MLRVIIYYSPTFSKLLFCTCGNCNKLKAAKDLCLLWPTLLGSLVSLVSLELLELLELLFVVSSFSEPSLEVALWPVDFRGEVGTERLNGLSLSLYLGINGLSGDSGDG